MTGFVEIILIVMALQTEDESVVWMVMGFVGLEERAMGCDDLRSARLFGAPLCSYLLYGSLLTS